MLLAQHPIMRTSSPSFLHFLTKRYIQLQSWLVRFNILLASIAGLLALAVGIIPALFDPGLSSSVKSFLIAMSVLSALLSVAVSIAIGENAKDTQERFGHLDELSLDALGELEKALLAFSNGDLTEALKRVDECEQSALQLTAQGVAEILGVKASSILANLMIAETNSLGRTFLKEVKCSAGDGRSNPNRPKIPLEVDFSRPLDGAPKSFVTRQFSYIPDSSKVQGEAGKIFNEFLKDSVHPKPISIFSIALVPKDENRSIAVLNIDSPRTDAFPKSTHESIKDRTASWQNLLVCTAILHNYISRIKK